jgi:hypothetical protein
VRRAASLGMPKRAAVCRKLKQRYFVIALTQSPRFPRWHMSACRGITASLIMFAGCRRNASPAHVSQVAPANSVPAVAPDTLPRGLLDSLGLVKGPGGVAMVRGIVVITFKPSASRQEKQATVDAVNGVVVGGFNRTPVSEYFVRIRGLRYEDIQAALRMVRSHPQVESAYPVMKESAAGTPSTDPPN